MNKVDELIHNREIVAEILGYTAENLNEYQAELVGQFHGRNGSTCYDVTAWRASWRFGHTFYIREGVFYEVEEWCEGRRTVLRYRASGDMDDEDAQTLGRILADGGFLILGFEREDWD